MKKYVLTIITVATALPLFAFNFNEDNFEINTDIKAEINAVINKELETAVKEKEIKTKQQNRDNKIIAAIEKEMKTALKSIKRNSKLRRNMFTRSFVEEQKMQKQKYENMLNQNVPTQIFMYMAEKFDLSKMQRFQVICIYHDDTIIEVRFAYPGKAIVVYYDYNYKDKPGQFSPITHKIS